MSIKDSELILNSDGSVYHLHLKPGDLASTVITVGDPDRVDQVLPILIQLILNNIRESLKHTLAL